MFDPSVIFQRTQAGRNEIQEKSHGLTQSERLVLIMVDGVSAFQGLRSKLPVLTDQRFERALSKLLQMDLVCEVFLPVEGQSADEIERSVIDRFLQQDPLDPVTIIVYDPEEELGALEEMTLPPPRPATGNVAAVAPEAVRPISVAVEEAPNPGPAMDEDHIRLAESLAEELRATQSLRAPRLEQSRAAQAMARPTRDTKGQKPEEIPGPAVHWGYWLIAIGLAFIGGFYLARLPI